MTDKKHEDYMVNLANQRRKFGEEIDDLHAALKQTRQIAAAEITRLESRLAKAEGALKHIFAATDPYADGAEDASAHDKLCNEIASLARPWTRTHSEND